MTLPKALKAGATTLTATTSTGAGDPAALDAVMLEPLVSRLVLEGNGHTTVLLRSASSRAERVQVRVPGTRSRDRRAYDGRGRLVERRPATSTRVSVAVPAGGFVLVRR